MAFRNFIAAMKSLQDQVLRIRWPAVPRLQPSSFASCRFASCGHSGSAPPSQGTHFFFASSAAVWIFMASGSKLLATEQFPHHRLQNAALLVVVEFDGGVDADMGVARLDAAAGGRGADSDLAAGLEVVAQAGDLEGLFAGESQRLPGLAFEELQRQDAHVDQVAAVDPLVARGDHRADA